MIRAFLSQASSRVLDVRLETGGTAVSLPVEEQEISLNVEALYALLPAAPQLHWRSVAGLCGSTVAPVYRSLQRRLLDDVEQVATMLVDLGLQNEADEDFESIPQPLEDIILEPDTLIESLPGHDRERSPSRRKSKSPERQGPLRIENDDPSIPTIVITPCEAEERESSCWVPVQDACFGNQLVVPSHPVVNDVYPPLLAKPMMCGRKWEYTEGHWRAVLPSLEEQVRRGLFSRVLSAKRRARHCR
ncbi:uncharacterized protein STEHIDRAFT_143747 [Stereum hirsutum FP-91666 SS1]|uniref:uncharacterized protein n=1 Tax=Stereum hirsutum (strain FP-91666) TaxID=721885 RepID=UPI000440B1E4|nr:uncharacterized protein STEHIDRAFT_143747 [Stereum hirsutum FP-91666 SS1]EIM92362.1 hypothetical protein STEHIDRAFT_143747 [Stereum hirsutum FP-91666 SS1]